MEAIAKLNQNRGSARKARLVADAIRGLDVSEAYNRLTFLNKGASEAIQKLLVSAIKNWEEKNEESSTNHDLYIKTITVDGAGMMKRFRPAPHGRAHRIRKRFNHVTIIVDSREPVGQSNYDELSAAAGDLEGQFEEE